MFNRQVPHSRNPFVYGKNEELIERNTLLNGYGLRSASK